jgi:hypothetical protein
MANDVVFVKKQGGLGRPLTGSDHISGLLFYSDATLPTGFNSSNRVKQVFSIQDAEALGITNTGLGATSSTSTYLVTNKGTAGETVTVSVISVNGTLTLCSYVLTAADIVTTTTSALAVSTAINALTYLHGFSASPSTATITITAPKREGIYLNTGTPYSYTVTGTTTTWAATITQNVVVGIPSDIDVLYYHVKEYFRIQPKGNLYIGIYASADVGTFANVTDMQNFAAGKLRQVGVWQKSTNFATSQVTALQTVVNTNATNNKPLEIIYQGKFTTSVTLASLADLTLLTAPNVSVVFGQDGANEGYKLWLANALSIGCVGTTLGAVSLAKVNESISWVDNFNMSDVEFDTLMYCNGSFYSAQSDGQIDQLRVLGYIALKKFVDFEGSYFNAPKTAIASNNDYATIQANRVYNKIRRQLRIALLPQLSRALDFNSDGSLKESDISYFESLCNLSLSQMQRDTEISQFSVVIDPSQDALSTSNLVISVSVIPVGVSDTITVNVGFTLSI